MNIIKKMYSGIVREYCIKNGLYTKGTNNEYSCMLHSADNATSDSDIIAICRDIWEHSFVESYVSNGGDFFSFSYDFMKNCVHLFIQEGNSDE